MNRKQRRAHAMLWPVLAALMAITIVGAVAAKTRVDHAIARGHR